MRHCRCPWFWMRSYWTISRAAGLRCVSVTTDRNTCAHAEMDPLMQMRGLLNVIGWISESMMRVVLPSKQHVLHSPEWVITSSFFLLVSFSLFALDLTHAARVQPIVRAHRDSHETEGGERRPPWSITSELRGQTHPCSAFHERGTPFPLDV